MRKVMEKMKIARKEETKFSKRQDSKEMSESGCLLRTKEKLVKSSLTETEISIARVDVGKYGATSKDDENATEIYITHIEKPPSGSSDNGAGTESEYSAVDEDDISEEEVYGETSPNVDTSPEESGRFSDCSNNNNGSPTTEGNRETKENQTKVLDSGEPTGTEETHNFTINSANEVRDLNSTGRPLNISNEFEKISVNFSNESLGIKKMRNNQELDVGNNSYKYISSDSYQNTSVKSLQTESTFVGECVEELNSEVNDNLKTDDTHSASNTCNCTKIDKQDKYVRNVNNSERISDTTNDHYHSAEQYIKDIKKVNTNYKHESDAEIEAKYPNINDSYNRNSNNNSSERQWRVKPSEDDAEIEQLGTSKRSVTDLIGYYETLNASKNNFECHEKQPKTDTKPEFKSFKDNVISSRRRKMHFVDKDFLETSMPKKPFSECNIMKDLSLESSMTSSKTASAEHFSKPPMMSPIINNNCLVQNNLSRSVNLTNNAAKIPQEHLFIFSKNISNKPNRNWNSSRNKFRRSRFTTGNVNTTTPIPFYAMNAPTSIISKRVQLGVSENGKNDIISDPELVGYFNKRRVSNNSKSGGCDSFAKNHRFSERKSNIGDAIVRDVDNGSKGKDKGWTKNEVFRKISCVVMFAVCIVIYFRIHPI